MLQDALYRIDHWEATEGRVKALLMLDEAHPIFEGHFPGQPVLPGVCQVQIIKELLETALARKLFLAEAAQCKFLQMADPGRTPILEVRIDYIQQGGSIDAQAVIQSGEACFLKMNGRLQVMDEPG